MRRFFEPAEGPFWLKQVLASVRFALGDIWDVPIRLFRMATASLPAAADFTGGIAWDTTSSILTWSNGTTWVQPSLSTHTHTAAAITFAPAGTIAATNVQAAIAELDNEKQPLDAELTAIAGLTSAADRLPYFTGAGAAALATFTAAGRVLIDDPDAAAQRNTLGLVIGTHVQAWDADLDAVASSGIAAAWTAYTPTVTAGSGTFTTVSAAGRYKQIGKTVFFSLRVTITTNGTAGVSVDATLPAAAVNSGYITSCLGIENIATGNAVNGSIFSSGTKVSMQNFDGTYPGGSGYLLSVNGSYEAA